MTHKRQEHIEQLFSKCVDWEVRYSRNHHKVMWLKMPDGTEHILLTPRWQQRRLSHEDKKYLERIGGFLL